MTRYELVDHLIDCAKENWSGYWSSLPDHQRLRLAGLEEELRGITRQVEKQLWQLVAEQLDRLAREVEGRCGCGWRRGPPRLRHVANAARTPLTSCLDGYVLTIWRERDVPASS
jgi:hypothetical protein